MSKKPNRVVQYKIANEKFLEQKAQEEGIIALESGILMRQLELQAVTMQGIQALQQGDGEKARRFFQQAASQGNGDALNMLGQMYISGLGNTPINAQYGISLVQQAARVGCRAAQDYLRQRRIPW